MRPVQLLGTRVAQAFAAISITPSPTPETDSSPQTASSYTPVGSEANQPDRIDASSVQTIPLLTMTARPLRADHPAKSQVVEKMSLGAATLFGLAESGCTHVAETGGNNSIALGALLILAIACPITWLLSWAYRVSRARGEQIEERIRLPRKLESGDSTTVRGAEPVAVRVSSKAIAEHVNNLSRIGNLGQSPSDGFLRASWSTEETRAMDYIRDRGEAAGLIGRYDGIGNLYLTSPGDFDEVVQIGSHLDTVPAGGNFDGAAGIVAGLEAITEIIRSGRPIKKALELVVWRGEESATFGAAYKGCKMAFGMELNEGLLGRKFRGVTLENAMREQGAQPSMVRERRPTIDQEKIDRIAAHLELHIEQSKKLEVDGDDIGIVTSIRGPDRYRVEVMGEFDHSGATPMGVNYRSDANLAIANMQISMDELARRHIDEDDDIVQTVGLVNSDPDFNDENGKIYDNALTGVSGYGYFTIDFRSNNKAFRDAYVDSALALLKKTAEEQNVRTEITNISSSNPTEELSAPIQEKIQLATERLGYNYQYMSSGAGHDAAIVSQQRRSDGTHIPVGMIFIPCRNGKSHSRDEFATTDQITRGANVLATALGILVE